MKLTTAIGANFARLQTDAIADLNCSVRVMDYFALSQALSLSLDGRGSSPARWFHAADLRSALHPWPLAMLLVVAAVTRPTLASASASRRLRAGVSFLRPVLDCARPQSLLAARVNPSRPKKPRRGEFLSLVAAAVRRLTSNAECGTWNAEWEFEPRYLGCGYEDQGREVSLARR